MNNTGDNKSNELQKEIDNMKQKMDEKEKQNGEIIKNLQEEVRESKFQLANNKYQSEIEIMKYKNIVKKLTTKLESVGIKIKENK